MNGGVRSGLPGRVGAAPARLGRGFDPAGGPGGAQQFGQAATYVLRFFSHNVRQLTPTMLTVLQLVLTVLTGIVIWFIWWWPRPAVSRRQGADLKEHR